MGREIRAVLFDFGSTLFAHPSLADTIVVAGASVGHVIDGRTAGALAVRIDALAAEPAEVALGRDLDAAVWAQRWAVLYRVVDDRFPGLGRAIDASMHDPFAWVPFAATVSVLGVLHSRGVRVGVLSNTGWDVRGPFAVRGIDRFVDSFTLSCEVGAAKPDVAIFAAGCAAVGVDPAATLMVGDDARADVGGTTLGIRTLLLPPGAPGSDNGLGDVIGLLTASATGGSPTR